MQGIYDTHYDLLTYILMKKDEPEFLMKLCQDLYAPNNILGGIVNTYYMPVENMQKELKIGDCNVIEHFKTVNKVIADYNLLPNRKSILFAVEGCTFVKIEDLPILYELGLRSIIPVYNDDNIYGGGALGDPTRGLTKDGYALIDEAVRLNIIIDISHANHKTAQDILDYLLVKKSQGFNPVVIASHSNVYSLVQRERNIPDEIIKKVGLLDGIVGILPRKTFVYKGETTNYDEYFAKHIRYVADLIGIDKVCVASDDMEYHPDTFYHQNAMFNIRQFAEGVENALRNNNFTSSEITAVMQDNFKEKVLAKVA